MKQLTFLLILLPLLLSCSGKKSLKDRINERDYPSIFLAWSMADNLPDEDKYSNIARHDLYWAGPKALKVYFDGEFMGTSTSLKEGSAEEALDHKKKLLKKNPNLITIAEVRYRDAHHSFLPEDSPYWMRDEKGNRVFGWEEGKFIRLELRDTSYHRIIAEKSAAIINTGAVDGIFLDWWNEEEFLDERLTILKTIRKAIGEDALIIVNPNENIIPNSAPYVNGVFMECWDSYEPTPDKWKTYQSTLEWAEKNMREPRINCLEIITNDRNELNEMRATTALSLCVSEGYSLFADNGKLPTPDHLHDWYAFYDADLGIPLSKGFMRDDHAWERSYTNGIVIHNPVGNTGTIINFEKPHTSMSSGKTGLKHELPAFDGDIFITD